ncbi:MAG: hypothetical protein IKB01_00975 [Lachnospiraceae bacterium]|nr:hypothetical protein [Lachnospiraceae bacterium]
MNFKKIYHECLGNCIFFDNGFVEVGIPLEYGIRIGHFSLVGKNNVFFEQPADMQDLTTEHGWRVRGGHRLWLAPESEKVYYPDNDPIGYQLLENGVELFQREDPWLHVQKTVTLCFADDYKVEVHHRIKNMSEDVIEASLWAVTSVVGGGVQYIDFQNREGGMDHWHRISMWDYTNLGDKRAKYFADGIKLTHMPVKEKYKIGVGHPYGAVRYEMEDVTFIKDFTVLPDEKYPDGNVSYETFLCRHMVEMESLSPIQKIKPGDWAEHSETWELRQR